MLSPVDEGILVVRDGRSLRGTLGEEIRFCARDRRDSWQIGRLNALFKELLPLD